MAINAHADPVDSPVIRLAMSSSSEARREVALESPCAAAFLQHRHHVGALAHARSERERRPDVGRELEVLHHVPEAVLAQRLAGPLQTGTDNLAHAPTDNAEVVRSLT